MRRNRYHQRKRKRKCRPKRRGDNSNVSPDANPSKQISNRQTPRSRSESRCSCTIKMLTERHECIAQITVDRLCSKRKKTNASEKRKKNATKGKEKRRNNVPTISPLAIFASLSSAWMSAIASLMELCTTTSGAVAMLRESSSIRFGATVSISGGVSLIKTAGGAAKDKEDASAISNTLLLFLCFSISTRSISGALFVLTTPPASGGGIIIASPPKIARVLTLFLFSLRI